jgi:tRNA threonylcarbamoyladenosine biosynthesis protein TsaB
MERVLGFDTSTSFLSAALTHGSEVIGEAEVEPDPTGRPRHAQELLEAVEKVLGEGDGWHGVDLIAVGVGPGTFTGLRIGVSTARALAQSRGLPLAAVSSLAALGAGADGEPEILSVLDAKRSEVFAALYGAGCAERWEPWVGPPEELAARVRAEGRTPLAVGDGAVRFRSELEASGARIPADDDSLHRLRARCICRLAADSEAAPLAEIKPTYLRRPDAELWRERDRQPEPNS